MNCFKLSPVIIPRSMSSLGRFCFAGCKNLKNIQLPASVQSIGELCLGECDSLEYVVNHVESPVSASKFSDNESLIIYVPDKSLDAYRQHSDWNKYRLLPLSSAPGDVVANEPIWDDPQQERAVYDLSGRFLGKQRLPLKAVVPIRRNRPSLDPYSLDG